MVLCKDTAVGDFLHINSKEVFKNVYPRGERCFIYANINRYQY